MTSNFSFFTALIALLIFIMSSIKMEGYSCYLERIDLFFFAGFGFIASLIKGGVSVLHMKLEEIEAKL